MNENNLIPNEKPRLKNKIIDFIKNKISKKSNLPSDQRPPARESCHTPELYLELNKKEDENGE